MDYTNSKLITFAGTVLFATIICSPKRRKGCSLRIIEEGVNDSRLSWNAGVLGAGGLIFWCGLGGFNLPNLQYLLHRQQTPADQAAVPCVFFFCNGLKS